MFAFDRPEVRRFLIDNAAMFLDEYHADGLRFDEVSVIDAKGGWGFCQELTAELRARKPSAALIAEYWGELRWLAVQPAPGGMGFDLGYADGLRDAVRGALARRRGGRQRPVDIGRLGAGLRPAVRHRSTPGRRTNAWRTTTSCWTWTTTATPRIARLADGSDPRSWYARSRARVRRPACC